MRTGSGPRRRLQPTASTAPSPRTQPIVTGNDPGQNPGARDDHEKVAFVGQAPAKVRGAVEAGDLVVPSGDHDGTARAISPATYGPDDGPIVGHAWEATDEGDVSEVTVAVGLETGEALASTGARQQESVAEHRADVAAKAHCIDGLQAVIEARTGHIAELEVETEPTDERIDELEHWLAALEERLTSLEADGAAPVSADD